MNPAARKIVPKPKALNCPSCGSAIQLRAMGAAATVVCSYCSSTLDATNPQLTILQRWEAKIKVQPVIPLGTRGKLFGSEWEAIGFQQRGIRVDDTDYFWREYVLFNPYRGFRYLSEYDFHWSFVTPMQSLPAPGQKAGRPAMTFAGTTYDHFQSAQATTVFVIGEFPWQVRVGEVVTADDYVAPPKMLSSETTANEVTWSRGEYVEGKEIWAAFQLPGAPPAARGVYSIQPSPAVAGVGRPWKFFLLMALLLFVSMIFFAIRAQNLLVFEQTFTFDPTKAGEKSFVTKNFELAGGKKNLRVELTSDVTNSWLFLGMALINDQTGEAFDFGRQVSYYAGVDEGESWSEGDRYDMTTLGAIPDGRYYLRIEPESEPPAPGATALTVKPIQYTVRLTRDVPYYFRYFLGIFLLLLPLPFMGRKGSNFERLRWAESDYGAPPGAVVWKAQSAEDDDE